MVAEDNPFVRFKNYIDNNVRRGFDALLGSSAPPSPSPSPAPAPAPTAQTALPPATGTTRTTITSSSSSSQSQSHPDPSTTHTTSTTTTTTATNPLSPREQSPQQQQQQPSSASTWSSLFKMAGRPFSTSSNAGDSEPHTTGATSPTTPTTPATTATSGSTSTVTMDDVHAWSVQSPYSPLNLQHLPQPTPRGLAQTGENPFTFRDAFEDLLVAGSGEPLPSALELSGRKVFEASISTHPAREPGLHVAHWVSGLAALGLWDAYFHLEQPTTVRPAGRYAGADHSRQRRRMYFRQEAPQLGGLFDTPFGTSFGGAWGNRGIGDEERWRWEDRDVRGRGHFDAQGVWDAAWRLVREGEEQRDEGRDADVEDELYGTATSRAPYQNGTRGPQAPRRIAGLDDGAGGGLRKPAFPEVSTTVYADGSKSVRTTERRVENGKTTVITTAQHFDPSGNLTYESRENASTKTWHGKIPGAEASFSWSWNSDSKSKSGGDGQGRDNTDEGGEGKGRWGDQKDEKTGWFWRR
ncbi:hypothetical protein F5Y10DRAFT_258544 [Nemania abortiva]|nr:hypothetical protein F5Y10DRAFT_258544 [Nemania abortiva]